MTTTFTFGDYTKRYLSECQYEMAPSTFKSLNSKVNNLNRFFGKRDISTIRQSDIKAWKVKVHKKLSNKTINEHFTILRAVCGNAFQDGILARNPMTDMANLTTGKTEPNPFTKSELKKIVESKTGYKSEQNLCLLSCTTGLRISEVIALDWKCVDFERRQILIDKCKVLGKYNTPKTPSSNRVVEIDEHAIAILQRQYKLTGHLKAKRITILQADNKSKQTQYVQHVFMNTQTGQPFIDSKQYAKSFFTPFLKQLDIKHRGTNQARHTFASHCLTSGVSKEWVARQLGHNGTAMVDKHYARWIAEDAPHYSKQFSDAMNDVFGESEIKHTMVACPQPSIVSDSNALEIVGRLLIAIEHNPFLASSLEQALSLPGGAHE